MLEDREQDNDDNDDDHDHAIVSILSMTFNYTLYINAEFAFAILMSTLAPTV